MCTELVRDYLQKTNDAGVEKAPPSKEGCVLNLIGHSLSIKYRLLAHAGRGAYGRAGESVIIPIERLKSLNSLLANFVAQLIAHMLGLGTIFTNNCEGS